MALVLACVAAFFARKEMKKRNRGSQTDVANLSIAGLSFLFGGLIYMLVFRVCMFYCEKPEYTLQPPPEVPQSLASQTMQPPPNYQAFQHFFDNVSQSSLASVSSASSLLTSI
jgi:hypothetical protein